MTILSAAAEILERERADRLTTNHIAERAGFSVGTVYQYFSDKRAILSALADHGLALAQDEIRAEAHQAAPCDLETVARIIVGVTLKYNCGFRDKVTAMLLSRFDRREFEHVKDTHDSFGEFVRGVLCDFVPDEVRELSPASAYVLVSAILGPAQCASLAASPLLRTREFEDELVKLFVAYARREGPTMAGDDTQNRSSKYPRGPLALFRVQAPPLNSIEMPDQNS